MEYQSFGRAHRPKGLIIKQALKVMLVLAVGSWLLYEINHSRNNTENYGDQTKLDGGYRATLMGRKGMPDEIVLTDSGNVDSEGAKEDKAEEAFGHINEKFSTREEVEHGQGSQTEVSSNKTYKDLSKTKSEKVGLDSLESRRSELSHKENGNGKYPKRPIINDSVTNDKEKEVQLREQPNDVQVRKKAISDFLEKENDGDEELRIREIDEVQIFHDENGVPPDVNDTEIVYGQAHILHEENITNVSNRSWLHKNIYEFTYVEENTVEVNLEASKNGDVEEINTGSITHVDTSGIKRNSEIGEGDS